MNTITLTIHIKDHNLLSKIASENDRKLIDQFHVIMKNFEVTK